MRRSRSATAISPAAAFDRPGARIRPRSEQNPIAADGSQTLGAIFFARGAVMMSSIEAQHWPPEIKDGLQQNRLAVRQSPSTEGLACSATLRQNRSCALAYIIPECELVALDLPLGRPKSAQQEETQ